MNKTLTAMAILLACSVALSGCSNRPHLPPIFRIDEIKYWWEGPELIVSVTFTNQANFTPGIGALAPMIDVLVYK